MALWAVWNQEYFGSYEAGDEAACTKDAECEELENKSDAFAPRTFHRQYCCGRFKLMNSKERTVILDEHLRKEGCVRRSDSRLCSLWISGLKSEMTAAQVAAVMRNTKFLFGFSHIAYSNTHMTLNSLMERIKFRDNLTWSKAGGQARSEVRVDYGSHRERDIQCWTCGDFGHMSYECDERDYSDDW